MDLTMNHDQIESAIEHAINALALAKLALSKSALPVFDDSDILRKVDHVEPRAVVDSYDTIERSVATILADTEMRIKRLEERRDQEAQQERERMAERLGRPFQREAAR
jgi:hypothetical protein